MIRVDDHDELTLIHTKRCGSGSAALGPQALKLEVSAPRLRIGARLCYLASLYVVFRCFESVSSTYRAKNRSNYISHIFSDQCPKLIEVETLKSVDIDTQAHQNHGFECHQSARAFCQQINCYEIRTASGVRYYPTESTL